jgi:sugar phosphate isomerase/epimerase
VRTLLDDAGLKAVAGCDSLAHFEEDTGAALDFWSAIGAPDIALASSSAEITAPWPTQARLLAALARRLGDYQFRLAIDTSSPEALDAVQHTLGAEALCVQLDSARLEAAGLSAAAMVRGFCGRCPVLRVADIAGTRAGLPPGQGQLDWPSLFDAAEEAAVEWYTCSIDLTIADAAGAAALSYAFLAENA